MIHVTAIVDESAIIGENVTIGPYSIIGPDVEIGAGTKVGPHVVINGPTKIGKENTIFQFNSIGEEPQDKKYNGEPTRLIVGDRNVIREYVTLNRGTVGGIGETVIGNDNLFMAYSHVAHDCIIGNHTIFANGATLAGHVEIGNYAILGGFTLVHQFTHIGRSSLCGMGSAISQDIPPFCTAAGNRARTIGINKEGLRRKGFSEELIQALHRSFREILFSKSAKETAFVKLQPLCDKYPEVLEFVNFIKNSKRGIAQ